MEPIMALQVKTVGRVVENTDWRATTEALSRSPARISDWTRLWRLRRGPTRAEVVSGWLGSRLGRGELGSRWSACSGGSMRRRRLRRRRSAAASSAEEKAKERVGMTCGWGWCEGFRVKVGESVVVWRGERRRRERRRKRVTVMAVVVVVGNGRNGGVKP
ncbi:hypothetical protein Hanom_Chr06g00534421 [Helianthus anomalus]